MCLTPPVHGVDFCIEAFQWRITIKATPMGVEKMLGVGLLRHQLSHAFDDVSTAVFDRALVIFISSHIIESV